MKIIESYIFKRMFGAFILTLFTLSTTVWMTQALRAFDLVTAQGQSIWTFFKITLLLLPGLAMIVSPIALIIAVVYTFYTLNFDSELVVINASGASQKTLLKPVLIIGLVAAVLMGSLTLYFTPLSLRLWRTLITDVRADIVTSILEEGQFMSISEGLTFHLRRRSPDGSLEGIFVSDDSAADATVTYLAENGVILDNPLGTFLIMRDGTIQRENKSNGAISMIEFSSYAFDLSTFASRASVPALKPRERNTTYLISPSPEDRYYQQYPEKFSAELHDRLAGPLYAFIFAILPLAYMSQAESTRNGRGLTIAAAVTVAFLIRMMGYYFGSVAEYNPYVIPLMYVLPIGTTLIAASLVLRGIQLRVPEKVVMLADSIGERLSGLMRPPTQPTVDSQYR
jgi:lipopolysaccharide export system permease protein